jgi:hypothetical protein
MDSRTSAQPATEGIMTDNIGLIIRKATMACLYQVGLFSKNLLLLVVVRTFAYAKFLAEYYNY